MITIKNRKNNCFPLVRFLNSLKILFLIFDLRCYFVCWNCGIDYKRFLNFQCPNCKVEYFDSWMYEFDWKSWAEKMVIASKKLSDAMELKKMSEYEQERNI